MAVRPVRMTHSQAHALGPQSLIYASILWVGRSQGYIKILDQTKLPEQVVYCNLKRVDQVVNAIKTMKVRGAPLIGATAAFGCVLGSDNLEQTAAQLIDSRPTAINLKWAVDRMLQVAREVGSASPRGLKARLLDEAIRIAEEDIEANQRLGDHGAKLIEPGASVLTVCNAGALATVGVGTAIGVIDAAHKRHRQTEDIHVYAAETRPRLQGAKLTAWELIRLGVPFTVITDNTIATLMAQKKIDVVVVGADRIAANGDTANKIGTYSAAVSAMTHGLPFYVAAPVSTIDFKTPTGAKIPIEERGAEEVTHISGVRIVPQGVRVANQAFDVTPARFITRIITERGVFPPDQIHALAAS
ncbi:S-methyl-5-thioribose-1-phosphate isomerase [Candidatus Margulisiibacteriota bacterium]